MARIIYAAVLLLTLVCVAHATDPVDVVTTTDGKTFSHVTVNSVKGDKVLLNYQDADGGVGGALVALDSLSDETRHALGLRTRPEQTAFVTKQAAFDEEQAKKGLVKSGNDWVTPGEKQRRETPFLIYADKPRNEAWFNAQYDRFKTSIVHADGKFNDIGPALLANPRRIEQEPPAQGSEIRFLKNGIPGSQQPLVLQILDKENCLVEVEEGGESMILDGEHTSPLRSWCFRLTGWDTSRMTDGIRIEQLWGKGQYLVYVGTYRYTTPQGASTTVPSYAPLRPLTKDEFKKCLTSGFRLVEYTRGPQGAVGNQVP